MEIVKLDSGYISGTVLGDPENPIHVYRGIPYAAPPVGGLRWKSPQPVVPWSGVRECTEFSAIAPQANTNPINASRNMLQNEDCLYLNIMTPVNRTSEKLPVMVWLHGGGFSIWSGNDSYCNEPWLPLKEIVLATVNMRLGVLGLTAHPLLSKESPEGVSGNYIFLDIIAALKWIKNNIFAFGGDPDNITIFGESGGSAKAVNLMASPLAKGLFHKAIGESGGGKGASLKEMEERGEKLFSILEVDKKPNPLTAAQILPWERIIKAGQALTAELKIPGQGPRDSSVDGWFLEDTTASTFKAGKQNVVPFILVANLGEVTGSDAKLSILIPTYHNLLKGANKAGGKAYVGIFDRVPTGWNKQGVQHANHGMDLPYVFNHMDLNSDSWSALKSFLSYIYKDLDDDPGFDEADTRVSELMLDMWANFAKTGNPSIEGIIGWPAWDETKDQYLYITENPEVRSGFSKVAQK